MGRPPGVRSDWMIRAYPHWAREIKDGGDASRPIRESGDHSRAMAARFAAALRRRRTTEDRSGSRETLRPPCLSGVLQHAGERAGHGLPDVLDAVGLGHDPHHSGGADAVGIELVTP